MSDSNGFNTDTNNAAATAEQETAGSVDSAAERQARLKSIQEKTAQLLREGRHAEARRVLKEAEGIRKENQKEQWLAEARAEREKALELINDGEMEQAQQALARADELEKKATGVLKRTKNIIGSVRSLLPGRAKSAAASDNATETTTEAETAPADPLAESIRIVSLHSKVAAGLGLVPGPVGSLVGVLSAQVSMVWRISRAFGHNVTKEQVRGVLISLLTSVIPVLAGQGAGLLFGALAIFIATPVLAYALTKAVGSVFIMHFESGGTLLTFDPKAFTEHFVNEFKKAGGTIHESAQTSAETAAATA